MASRTAFPFRPSDAFAALAFLVSSLGCHAARPTRAETPVGSARLPATIAGTRLGRLLAAYNANDSAALVRVVADDYGAALRGGLPAERVAVRWHELYASVGPLAVDSVTASTEHTLRVWARGAATKAWIEFLVAVDSAAPHQFTRIGLGRGLTPSYQRAIGAGRDVSIVAAYLDTLAAQDRFSGIVVVARDGRTVLERSYGFANVAARRPISTHTRFSLASVGKMFTATAIALLVRDGRLRLEDTVARYLPELPKQVSERITIGQLLTHRSGYGELGPEFDTVSFVRARDYVRLFRDTTLAFAPGTAAQYSNRGYILLGAVVESVTGETYEGFLRRALFEPLGMRETGFTRPTELGPADAIGYTRYPSIRGGFEPGDRRVNTALLTRGSPAGGIYSSADDLLRFAEALRTNRLGAPGGRDSLFTAATAEAYGFMIGRDAFGHGGSHPGVSANVQVLPRQRVTVVMLSNYDAITNHVAAFAADVLGRRR